MNLEEVDLRGIIEDCFKLLNLQATYKGLQLKFRDDIGDGGSSIINTDGNRLRQILTNLIGNAIKFTFHGSITVRISDFKTVVKALGLERDFPEEKNDNEIYYERSSLGFDDMNLYDKTPDYERSVLIEVIDTGIGIMPENIESLFKLFGILPQSNNNINKHGIGLGLAISQSLVKSLNGNIPGREIKVQSEIGKGSNFSFPLYFNLNENIQNDQERTPQSYREPSLFPFKPSLKCRKNNFEILKSIESEAMLLLSSNKRKNVKILVVDDDQINLLVANSILRSNEELDFQLITANNGSEAIDLVLQNDRAGDPFDIILMDCNMPIMDGFEASKIIKNKISRREISSLFIIAVTANVGSTDREKCMKARMDDFISKPYSRMEILNLIKKLLNGQQN